MIIQKKKRRGNKTMESLPAKPNRTLIYYKITNKDEIHHNLQYKTGLIIDPEKFDNDSRHSCVKGIYFTTAEYLHKFFGYGKWIRPVVIPKNAKVILDPDGNKYRADQLFFHPKKEIEFYFTHLFNKKTFPKKDWWLLASRYSKYFDKWFDKEIFPKESCWYLAEYCSNHFNKWFDKKTFPKGNYRHLKIYCSKQLKERKIKL